MLHSSLQANLLFVLAACTVPPAPPDLVSVNGRIFTGADSQPWADSMAIEQALRAYTAGSAFAGGREADKGTLEAGKLADLAVLSQDTFEVPPNAPPATTSVLTIVGGRIVHDAASTSVNRRPHWNAPGTARRRAEP